MNEQGIIYNIQHYSLHDGSGIRTVVFFKGCPLRCRWCCNPESQNLFPEISYLQTKCIGIDACGLCRKVCERNAIGISKNNLAVIDRHACDQCLQCASSCPSVAIHTEGKPYTVSEVIDAVEQDAIFYRDDGGLTISGGEPLMQIDFLIALLTEAKKRKIHTAIETCGFADYNALRRAAELLDYILYDIKSMDNEQHLRYTNQSNERILSNFERLCSDFPKLPKLVRTPIIPDFNNSAKDIEEILAFIEEKPNVSFERLPYHRLGVSKYAALGRKYQLKTY